MGKRDSQCMSFDEKIDLLLRQVQNDNRRFDFRAMGSYVEANYDPEDLEKYEGINYIPGAFAILYAQQKLEPHLYEILKSNHIELTDELDSQLKKQVADCWQEGFPLYKWRKEKICYSFNKTLSQTLLDQLDNVDNSMRLPAQVVLNLKNRCAFITTEGNIFGPGYTRYTYGDDSYEIIGFIYTIDPNSIGNATLIDICPVVTCRKKFFVIENYYMLVPYEREITLDESVGTVYQYNKEFHDPDSEFMNNIRRNGGPAIQAALQYILYLCSEEAEITQSEGNIRTYRKANPDNIKDKYREVLRYDVGNEIGELLSKKEEKLVSTNIHLRRAHWHHRWVGKRNTDDRRLELRWQRPSIVHRKCKAWSELGDEIIKAEGEADFYWETDVASEKELYDSIEYLDRPIPKPQKPQGVVTAYTYSRSKKVACNAMIHVNYQCEIDKTHNTFIRKSNGTPYVEPHHLVPMAFQDDFEVSLDREQNIVVLCSNCHRNIHYGIEKENLLRKLYDARKSALDDVGIEISAEELLQMYR